MKEHIQHLLEQSVATLKSTQLLPSDLDPRIQVDRCKDRAHGDWASNLAMIIAKAAGKPPREIAQQIMDHLPQSAQLASCSIAGPGFINFTMDPGHLARQVESIAKDPHANIARPAHAQTIVVDYSAPNVAKEMHVGHIRSTLIGDSLVRTLEFLGHTVIRANHLGDWGTQFGMLIAHLEDVQNENPNALTMELSDVENFYRESKKCYDSDPIFAERARNYVVRLQSGDEDVLAQWQKLVDVTLEQNQKVYERLNVTLTRNDVMGESMYNGMLPDIVADLQAKGLAVEDDGALVVFLPEFANKEGEPMGVIIRKKDGGFLYTTTDIACAKYRYETLGAERILYFIDSRQHQHLMQAWTIVRKAGYVPDSVPLEHHAFGMMLGKDGRPFKTRAGGTVRLSDLLDEAQERASQLLEHKLADLDANERNEIINTVAIGAVKYADLSKNRTTDYIFDWDNMLSFDGNTAPYLQYAYTRIQSVFRKANVNVDSLAGQIVLSQDAEQVLAQKLTQFNEVVQSVAAKGMPHLLCTYLYSLSGAFMSFYEACPINKEGVSEVDKQSRLMLCAATAKNLKIGLHMLGIKVLERM